MALFAQICTCAHSKIHTDDPLAMAQLMIGSRVIIEGGYAPHVQDVLLSVSDWRPWLDACARPISFIHGEQDVFWNVVLTHGRYPLAPR